MDNVPGAFERYGAIYDPHVSPDGGLNWEISSLAHCTGLPKSKAFAIPPTQYVSGETRYIKIQNPGSAETGCMIPLNTKIMMKSKVTMLNALKRLAIV